MKTQAEAIQYLSGQVPCANDPVLSVEDITGCVTESARFTDWIASTAYSVGDKIIPTTPNGRVYQCVVAGTSDATEVDWPYREGHYPGYEIGDGDDLIWRDIGPMPPERYDLKAAIRAAWLLKASRTAEEMDASEGPQSIKLSQRHERFLAMARRFRPQYVV